MLVVADTSPLLNLAIVGRLDLVKEQLGQVVIPRAVLAELRVEEELPGSAALRQALAAGWLRVQNAVEDALVHILLRDLDRGETEAIALAAQLGADLLMVDEREARRAAKALGIPVFGVVGVLLRARVEGRIESLGEALSELRTQAGFWLDDTLVAEALDAVGEGEADHRSGADWTPEAPKDE